MTPEQRAHVEAIAAGDISKHHLAQSCRWWYHRGYHAARATALQELEERWQDLLLAIGSQADIGRYAGLLTTAGMVARLRFLRGAIWRAQHAAELKRRRKPTTWREVQQQVYRETSGLLQL